MTWESSPTRARRAVVAVSPPAAGAVPEVSFVIVTFGTGEIVLGCLEALVAHVAVPFEVIVVDNACPGGMPTADRLRLTTSGVRLLRSDTNLGFGGANDIGIAHAQGQLLCLINPDVIVTEGWLEPLLAALADPSVGIAAPVLCHPDGTMQEAGQTVDASAITRASTVDPGRSTIDVDYSSAACWLLRRQVHEAVGGFDPAYHPAYFEDVDLSWRVRRAGWRTVVVGASRVIHDAGRSTRFKPRPALAQQEIFRRRWSAELAGR